MLDQNKSIKHIYQECLRNLVKTLNENYDHTKANFDSRLEIGNMLMEVNINEYKVAIETGKYIDSMKLNFKLYELQTSETLNLNLKEECDNLIKKIKDMSLCDEALKNNLDKLKLLSLNFQNIDYSTELVDSKLENLRTNFDQA